MKSNLGAVVGRGLVSLILLAAGVHAQPAAAPAEAKEPLLVEGDPIVKNWVVPEFPPELLTQKVTGDATVHLIVDEKGLPQSVKVAKASEPRFGEAFSKAVAACTFSPAVEQGRIVPAGVSMTWHFGLPYRPSTQMPPLESYPRMLPKKLAAAESTPDAEYPDSLIDRQLNGEVLFELTVSAEGAVSDARILGATQAEFVRPALEAVKLWKFTPARQGDLAIKDVKRAPVSFIYQSRDSTDKRTQLEANGFTAALVDGAETPKGYDVPPSITTIVDPVFPQELLKIGEAGQAEVALTVSAQGLTEDVVVTSASTPACGASVAAALEATVFSPALLHGQAVPTKLVKKHKFVLPADAAQPDEQAEVRLLRTIRGGETIPAAKGLDGKLRPVWRALPVYPAALKTERLKGTAMIEFVIDRTGRARVPKVISATHEAFGWSAATAVSQWVFDPPTRGGQPTDVRVQIPVQFSPP